MKTVKKKYDRSKYKELCKFAKTHTALYWRSNRLSIRELFFNAVQVYEMAFLVKYLELYSYSSGMRLFKDIERQFQHPHFNDRFVRSRNLFTFLYTISKIPNKDKHNTIYKKYKEILPEPIELFGFEEFYYFMDKKDVDEGKKRLKIMKEELNKRRLTKEYKEFKKELLAKYKIK